jgi:hypothetical protein
MRLRFISRPVATDFSVCRLRRAPHVLATPQGEELVLFDTARERYYTLDEVGASVWAVLAEPATLDELTAATRREYEAPAGSAPGMVRDDVARLLRELHSAGMLSVELPLRRPT